MVLLAVGQNITYIVFYASHHFLSFFSFGFSTKGLQLFCLFFIGTLFVLLISFFFMCQYFHKENSKIFLANMFLNNKAFILMFFRFTLKPIVESIIHSYCYENHQIQILLIIAVQITSLMTQFCFEMKLNIFKSKLDFTFCLLCDSLMIILFVLILFKYDSSYGDLWDVFENCISAVLYITLAVIILSFIKWIVFEIIGFLKIRKKDIDNDNIK